MKISPLFESKQYNKTGLDNSEKIAKAFTTLLNELFEVLPCGREFSIVQTKLEEASFFAKKALGTDEVNTVKQEPKGYIVEVKFSSSYTWKRSGNWAKTVFGFGGKRISLGDHVFFNKAAAEREASEQERVGYGMKYRATEVK